MRLFYDTREQGSRARRPGSLVALAGCLALAGCGSTGTSSTTSTAGSVRPAASATAAPAPVSPALRKQEEAIHAQVIASLHNLKDKHVRYGTPPANLPKAKIPVDRVVTATLSHPALAIQGDTVRLVLGTGSALATGVGPDVPYRIQGTSALHTPATFDVTFAGVNGRVPLSASLFTITDEQGEVHHPRISVLGGGRLPAFVPTGRAFNLVLNSYLPQGNGQLRYSPGGGRWVVAWDFDVETD